MPCVRAKNVRNRELRKRKGGAVSELKSSIIQPVVHESFGHEPSVRQQLHEQLLP